MDAGLQERAGESVQTIVIVEGVSDRIALETLAERLGRDLAAEGVSIVPIGGAQRIGRYLESLAASEREIRVAGLCDSGEEIVFRRGLERAGLGSGLDRAGMEALGFFVCVRDLEDELVRAVGPAAMEEILAEHGNLNAFRTYQKQPAHHGKELAAQLRGFLTNHKSRYARYLVDAVELDRVPQPLASVLEHV
jgi:hypothetical protein